MREVAGLVGLPVLIIHTIWPDDIIGCSQHEIHTVL